MKLIFLDIHGVLMHYDKPNSDKPYYEGYRYQPRSIRLLRDLCAETGAEVVLSSSHRALGSLVINFMNAIRKHLEIKVIGCTDVNNRTRGEQIIDYINWYEHQIGKITNYVILDDDNDFTPNQQQHLVLSDMQNGFTEDHYLKARAILNK